MARQRKELIPLEVERVKYFKQFVIVKFRGLNHIEDIEKFVKKNLYVTRDQAVKLKKNEYFIADLIGLQVEDEEENELGTLTDVLATGANDVYVVEQNGKEVLIPAIRQCILDVDLEKKRMKVHLLEGLL